MVHLDNVCKIWIQQGIKMGKTCYLVTVWYYEGRERLYTMITFGGDKKLVPGSYSENVKDLYQNIFEGEKEG